MSIQKLKEMHKANKNKVEPLFALIIGQSGAGKSYFSGTSGLPTLFLYLRTEQHGPQAAASTNNNILPVCLDKFESSDSGITGLSNMKIGDVLSPDQTLLKLKHWSALNLKDEGIGAIVIDSLSDLESVIKDSTAFKQACLSATGKHNSYSEGPELIKKIREIVLSLNHHTDDGVHCFLTMAGTVTATDENGAAHTIQPKTTCFGSAELLPRLFPDILLVSRLTYEGETKFACIFNGNFERKGKDQAGRVLKTLNFSPRLTGLSIEDLPDLVKADLKAVLALKNKKESK
jgi:hypothetical protein